ncbi:hypothetical protein HW932_15905 [Allochromatium humboldtianum]|uniref:Uncharacterized protein n=1 Tax=Allochromatium humboldtianum TaxID=504901 RepID=A0A850R7S8_9GAMM|nr:bluetail domain-containing putative surface protein [Allochromatium humboldtianum]NVZ10749.1 hypothetical protein [Allochromatium humboldtianum]
MNVTTVGTPTTLNGADIQGVEVFNIRVTGASAALDASTVAGHTEINADRGTGTLSVTNLASGAAYGIKGDGVSVLGNQAASYVATATSATLNISGGVGPTGTTAPNVTVAGTGATTATINSTGAANTIGTLALGTASTVTAATIDATTNLTTGAITAAALKTLTVKGAGAVNLSTTALATTVTSIDASANTGGVTVVSGHKQSAFTGGTGNDKLTIGTIVYDASAKIAGGDGTDTLAIADDTSTVFTTAAKANISGFEILEVGGASKTYDFTALTGLTGLNLAAATSATVNKLGAATPVTVTADQTTGLTINVNDATNPLNTTDSLTLTLDKAGAANATSIVTVANLTSNGLETLNIVSSGVSANVASATTDDNVVTTLAGLSTSNVNLINITGGSDLTLTTGAINKIVNIVGTNATGNLTIDASGNNSATGLQGGSGADKMIGVANVADVLKGNAGNDRLVTGLNDGATAAADNLSGGAGADTFVFAGKDDAVDVKQSSTSTTTSKITDFSYAEGDKIELVFGSVAQALSGSGGTKVTPGALGNAGLVTAANLGAAATAAFADSDQVTSSTQALAANAAVYFTWNDGTSVRSFIAVNDATAGFSATNDLVIEVTGIALKSGDAALGSLTVSDYFA